MHNSFDCIVTCDNSINHVSTCQVISYRHPPHLPHTFCDPPWHFYCHTTPWKVRGRKEVARRSPTLVGEWINLSPMIWPSTDLVQHPLAPPPSLEMWVGGFACQSLSSHSQFEWQRAFSPTLPCSKCVWEPWHTPCTLPPSPSLVTQVGGVSCPAPPPFHLLFEWRRGFMPTTTPTHYSSNGGDLRPPPPPSHSLFEWRTVLFIPPLIPTGICRNPQEWAGIHKNEQYVFLGSFFCIFLVFSPILYISHIFCTNPHRIHDYLWFNMLSMYLNLNYLDYYIQNIQLSVYTRIAYNTKEEIN